MGEVLSLGVVLGVAWAADYICCLFGVDPSVDPLSGSYTAVPSRRSLSLPVEPGPTVALLRSALYVWETSWTGSRRVIEVVTSQREPALEQRLEI